MRYIQRLNKGNEIYKQTTMRYIQRLNKGKQIQ